MPTYEYSCRKCGNTYEKREGFDAPPRQRCPKCRGVAQRVLYAPPIVFKGSGFYVTDSRKSESGDGGGESASATSDGKSRKSESDGSAGESTRGTSESKPEKSEKKDSGSAEPEAAAAS